MTPKPAALGKPRKWLETVDIMALAGGLGTGIQPMLADTPKLLAPLGSRPFLSYLMLWLTRFGARGVMFALGHAAAAAQDHLRDFLDPALKVVTGPFRRSILSKSGVGAAETRQFVK